MYRACRRLEQHDAPAPARRCRGGVSFMKLSKAPARTPLASARTARRLHFLASLMICGSTSSAQGVTQQPLKNLGAPSSTLDCLGVGASRCALQRGHRLEQADGVEVEDRFGVGVVAHRHVVAVRASTLRMPSGVGRQQVALERQAVAVARDIWKIARCRRRGACGRRPSNRGA